MTLHPQNSLEDTLSRLTQCLVDALPAPASMRPKQAAEMLATRFVLMPPRIVLWAASLYVRVRDTDAAAQCGRSLARKIAADFVASTRALAARLAPDVSSETALSIGGSELHLLDDACSLAPETDAGLVVFAAIETLECALTPWTGELITRGKGPDSYSPLAASFYDGRSFLAAPAAEAEARGVRFNLAEMGDELSIVICLYERMTALKYLRAKKRA